MKLRINILTFILLAALSAVVFFCLPAYTNLIPAYCEHIFYPFQLLRCRLFNATPLSIGDIIYVAMGIGLFITLLKWIFWLFGTAECGNKLAQSFVKTLNGALCIYLFFIMGWGANYYKPPLPQSWHLTDTGTALQQLSKDEFKQMVKADLTAFDTFLISRINEYAPHYHPLSFKQINRRAVDYYRHYTDSKVKEYGLGIKPSLFAHYMEYSQSRDHSQNYFP